ncbi:MAG: manganese catalase family protein, partial [Eubacteriales bacterium]
MNNNSKTKVLCTLPLPYPEIRVEGENRNYARMLSMAYAGQEGELGAVLSYLYGHLVSAAQGADMISATLECVSLTEMRHLEILGTLISMLGGDPRYCVQGRRTCFNAGLLNYAAEPSRIIRN